MTVAEGGGIFISYRRRESSDLAGRLYDRLADRFGEGQVFIDVGTLEPGADFAEEIFRAVAACAVMLAVIGPAWLTAIRRRLDDQDDFVRLEIEAALARGVRVIPILVEGAVMPGPEDLPESLAGLARYHALSVRHESFRYDVERLVAAIERMPLRAGTSKEPPAGRPVTGRSAGAATRWKVALLAGAAFASARTAEAGRKPAATADELDAVAEALAMAVRSALDAEERIRRVHDPFPLPVRWRGAPAVLMDHWQSIHGSPGKRQAIALDGSGGDISELFSRSPSRRLVVLGRAGAGKTIVVSRFVLALLDRRAAGDEVPVPVPMSAGSWDPAVPLRSWAAEQLARDHPMLGRRDGQGVTAGERLIATRRVMLVLDGLDEISAEQQPAAIRQINAGLGRGDWILVTSRPQEYANAVAKSDVITAAAVVQLRDLTAQDVAAYLPLTTRRELPDAARTKWQPAMARLRRPGGSAAGIALRAVLTTPLMVALARVGYSDTDADPAELAAGPPNQPAHPDVSQDLLRSWLENRLLAGFIPAVYAQQEDASNQRWPVADAIRWHQFLAVHLDSMHTQNLAWWELSGAVPRPVIATATSAAVTLPILTAIALVRLTGHWTRGGATIFTTGGLIFTVLSGIAVSLLAVTGLAMRPAPSRMRLQLRGQVRRVARFMAAQLLGWRAAAWIGTWTATGLGAGLIAQATLRNPSGIISGTASGLVIGFGLWFIVALVQGLAVIVDPAAAAGPAELLRSDRASGLRQGLVTGIFGAALIVAVLWEQFGFTYHLVRGTLCWVLAWAFAAIAATGMWIFPGMVWGPWLIARGWLALRDYLPWNLMAFLNDAHSRGVLRQSGGVYQFRHARLQQFLATPESTQDCWACCPEGHSDQDRNGCRYC